MNTGFVRPAIAIVLTACGIETFIIELKNGYYKIAIVLTACGIETNNFPYGLPTIHTDCNSTYRLRY